MGRKHYEVADCLGSESAMRNNVACAAGCSDLWNLDVGMGVVETFIIDSIDF
jgi:hypothetical protein